MPVARAEVQTGATVSRHRGEASSLTRNTGFQTPLTSFASKHPRSARNPNFWFEDAHEECGNSETGEVAARKPRFLLSGPRGPARFLAFWRARFGNCDPRLHRLHKHKGWRDDGVHTRSRDALLLRRRTGGVVLSLRQTGRG